MTEFRELWDRYCPDVEFRSFESLRLPLSLDANLLSATSSPVDFSDRLGQIYAQVVPAETRKRKGQFFTPPGVARFMARLVGDLPRECNVVEPGAGTGILLAALAEQVVGDSTVSCMHVRAYESDPALSAWLMLALGFTRHYLGEHGAKFVFEVSSEDFVLAHEQVIRPSLFASTQPSMPLTDVVLSNPPYFKLSRRDPRVAVVDETVHGQPNIYSIFMAVAAKSLAPGGQLVFIVPRSFCSGQYFRQFRKSVFREIELDRLHLFDSRRDTFSRDAVLQENVILLAHKLNGGKPSNVSISHSHGLADLESAVARDFTPIEILDIESPEAMIHIPKSETDKPLRELVEQWQARLHTYGLQISTGPVVPFRSKTFLRDTVTYRGPATAPLLWLQNVERFDVTWPHASLAKPQHLSIEAGSRKLLVPNKTYVLLRRFSAKEANGRLIASPYIQGELPAEYLGIENHINYIPRPQGELSPEEAWGLAAFLNSRIVEQYFRTYSGNTQVSATEIRNLPLPPLQSIKAVGRRLMSDADISPVAVFNQILAEELDIAITHGANGAGGGHMTKIEEAKDLLKALNLPPQQRNDIAALTLLAIANLSEDTQWKRAERRSITVHNIIGFIEANYGRKYAENTRETIRRQVIHQFEQARIVDRNPDEVDLPTNSPRTHYSLSEEVLAVVQHYGTVHGTRELERFKKEQGTLLEMYQKRRQQHLVPLRDTAGNVYYLSPGKHNRLQVAVVEEFAPRFAPGAKLLYLGDTASKMLRTDFEALRRVGFVADKHNKLPDVLLYSSRKRWLYLVEVVTSHGPVSPKRHRELEQLLSGSSAERIYVSAFPDFKEFKAHASNIAWETEVWIAEMPDHLIHFNGDRFLGPRRASRH